ncbi:MAG: ScpA family protein [Planctomycetota bacterium]|nr:ScpA family protein [Planctomycetota bacterium]
MPGLLFLSWTNTVFADIALWLTLSYVSNMDFVVDLAQFSGPLDLLLHIVRREELELAKLPLARITEQYLDFLEVLVELQIDDVADFLEVASLLVEMKSKQAIPRSEEEAQADEAEALNEMSDELVFRLMEYKRIRDAASILQERGETWQLRYSRLANELPVRRTGIGEQPIQPIEIWDLVSAFGRILRERQPPAPTVVYDDTPIHTYMERIHGQVCSEGRVELTSLFQPGMHKSSLVAMFLATLELTRHHGLRTDQTDAGHPLYLLAGEEFKQELDVAKLENLSFEQMANSNMPVAGR